ncbi:hypothetical protein [Alistipes putredinis]|uniref:hypothetical protein n=1 Tax=Alistipes putredinis TaxID=28117 RepID=UPI003995FDB8
MKRSVLLLAALFAVLSVQADNRPQAVLKQLTAALGALEGVQRSLRGAYRRGCRAGLL